MTLGQAECLLRLYLADGSGLQPSEISERMGICSSAPRRYLDLLGRRGRGDKPGLGLCEEEHSEEDMRVKIFSISNKGRRILESSELAGESKIR